MIENNRDSLTDHERRQHGNHPAGTGYYDRFTHRGDKIADSFAQASRYNTVHGTSGRMVIEHETL